MFPRGIIAAWTSIDSASLPGASVDLGSWPTDDDGGWDRDEAEDRTKHLSDELERLQELLYAESRQKLLVVIQATDTGGKDGTIRHVFDGVNPQGVKVASFKKPTAAELSHDYLWRVHAHTLGNGEITIFNRSHYEDVLVVRVHDLVPAKRWERRCAHINAFEEMLVDEGTTIVKLFLHISKDDQRQRLQDRLDEADKNWKFSLGDLDERRLWDDYQAAFTALLKRTSTIHSPWYVIPADRKWFRNLLVGEIVVRTLRGLDMDWPEPQDDLDGIVVN